MLHVQGHPHTSIASGFVLCMCRICHSSVAACRGPEQPEGLRRLVVKVGTAGGSNSHQLVYRCMQGLFREVGLSPNFIWDGSYEVPDKYLTYEHRKALEEARLLAKAQGIQAMQRGMRNDTYVHSYSWQLYKLRCPVSASPILFRMHQCSQAMCTVKKYGERGAHRRICALK